MVTVMIEEAPVPETPDPSAVASPSAEGERGIVATPPAVAAADLVDAVPDVAIPPSARCKICREAVMASEDLGAVPRKARYACYACGAFVCSGHHWVMLGVCRGCASAEDVHALRETRSSQRFKELLGIKWIE